MEGHGGSDQPILEYYSNMQMVMFYNYSYINLLTEKQEEIEELTRDLTKKLEIEARMGRAKTLEIEQLTRQKEGKL